MVLSRATFIDYSLVLKKKNVTLQNMENWFEENDADRGSEILSVWEIADIVRDSSSASSSSDSKEKMAERPRMSKFVDVTNNQEIKGHYQHL